MFLSKDKSKADGEKLELRRQGKHSLFLILKKRFILLIHPISTRQQQNKTPHIFSFSYFVKTTLLLVEIVVNPGSDLISKPAKSKKGLVVTDHEMGGVAVMLPPMLE